MKRLNYIFIFLFLFLCFVPSILMTAGFKNPNRENRPLAKLPVLFKDGSLNTDFFDQLDDYVEDRFALKDVLVNAFNTLDAAILGDVSGDNAVIGKDNFIFYGETVDDHLGINGLTEAEICSIVNYLSAIQAELSENGTVFAFMIAPNKATIYPELMPDHLIPTENERNIDLLTSALLKAGVNVVDAKSTLIEGKRTRSVYYEHDSHWNNYGAMLVFNETSRLFGLEAFDAEDYTTVFDRVGDLHYFVYPTTEYLEERIVYPERAKWSSRRPIDFDRDKEVETASDVNGLTMVVYHDSFGRSLQPILSQSVGKLFMNSYFPYDMSFVERNSPDLVLIELVERNLDKLAAYAQSLGY